MTVPAALSLLQDTTFYFALSMVMNSQMAFLSVKGFAVPVIVFLTRCIIRKVYTAGMLLSLVLLLGGTGLAFAALGGDHSEMTIIFQVLIGVSATS